MLLFEGVMPLLLPQSWRETFRRMIELKDDQLRLVGFLSVTIGFILIMLTT